MIVTILTYFQKLHRTGSKEIEAWEFPIICIKVFLFKSVKICRVKEQEGTLRMSSHPYLQVTSHIRSSRE
jgi:hypothetical protein